MLRPWIYIAVACLACAAKPPKFDPDVALAIQPGTSIEQVIARLGKPKMRMIGPHGGQMLSWIETRGGFFSSPKIRGAILLFDKDGKFIRPAPPPIQPVE